MREETGIQSEKLQLFLLKMSSKDGNLSPQPCHWEKTNPRQLWITQAEAFLVMKFRSTKGWRKTDSHDYIERLFDETRKQWLLGKLMGS